MQGYSVLKYEQPKQRDFQTTDMETADTPFTYQRLTVRTAAVAILLTGILLTPGLAASPPNPSSSDAIHASSNVQAQFTPAVMTEGDRSFEAQVDWPKLSIDEGVVVVLFCNLVVTISGTVARPGCVLANDPVEKKLSHAAKKGLRTTLFTPGTVDGKAVHIHLYFRLLLKCVPSACTVKFFYNLRNTDQYGAQYVAPQLWFHRQNYP